MTTPRLLSSLITAALFFGSGAAGDGASPREAGQPCGGIAGEICGSKLYCAKPQGTCGVINQLGTCAITGGFCTYDFVPLCGCDNKTYRNMCEADMAGVNVAYKGECKKKPKKAGRPI
jgi:hypothetical protein